MHTTFYLVRHGQSTGNAENTLTGHSDVLLTELGCEQALQTAGQLIDKQIDFIYCSPLQRALETAIIIGKELDLPVSVWDSLIERDLGVYTEKPVSIIKELPDDQVLKTDGVTYFLGAEDSESFPDLLERARGVLYDLENLHPGKTVLLVAHGDIAKMFYAAYEGMDWRAGLLTPYLDNAGILEMKAN